jgi:HD-like signal output (HDOD) protein
MERLAADRDKPLHVSENLMQEVLETLHCDMGYRLMLKWELPEQYARVARDHHAMEFEEADVLLNIVRLLDTACKKLGIGQAADADIVLAATQEAQTLGLKDIKLAELEVMLEDAVEQASDMMS